MRGFARYWFEDSPHALANITLSVVIFSVVATAVVIMVCPATPTEQTGIGCVETVRVLHGSVDTLACPGGRIDYTTMPDERERISVATCRCGKQ